jgi:hypothetical protein
MSKYSEASAFKPGSFTIGNMTAICVKCKRPLKTPTSIKRGIGVACAQKENNPYTKAELKAHRSESRSRSLESKGKLTKPNGPTLSEDEILIRARSPIGIETRSHRGYWNRKAVASHPSMKGKENLVLMAIESPFQIRQSVKDDLVYLFYKESAKRYICAVVRKVDESSGFLITAYESDAIKDGVLIWEKKS